MNDISSWEAQTRELLNRVWHEIEEIQFESQQRIATLQQRASALEEALTAYREMMGVEAAQTTSLLKQKDIKNRSQREILHLIAEHNDGLLVARTAIKLMKDANVFGNPLNASAQVYAILNRSKDFVKVGKGVYMLNGHEGVTASHPKKDRTGSGLRQVVKELKEKHPQITKKEILRKLERIGFDFQAKRPGNAVHMAWISLGYSKK